MKKLTTLVVTAFGLGRIPFAPGTMGSLGALMLWAGAHYFYEGPCLILMLISGAAILNFTFVPVYLKHTNGKDPKEVVIDEVLGQFIALIPAGMNPLFIGLSFLFFRLFDIWKPWPICVIDRFGGTPLKNTFSLIFDDVGH